jgi:IclR family acetate operon transcriptional repressor
MTQTPSIQVIHRAARLMDAIAANAGHASLKVLAAETGLHPSTAFRILAALGEVGFVERDGAGHYRLGRKLGVLGASAARGVDLRAESLDLMERLRDRVGETVNLTVREGDQVIYVERVSPQRMMRVEQVIGSRAPLHVTAVGKLMLRELGEPFVAGYAERTGLPRYTPHTIGSLGDLRREVDEAGRRGIAFDNEEAEEGVGCIGALVRDASGAVVAGLSISAPMDRRQDEWARELRATADAISERLGYAGRGR